MGFELLTPEKEAFSGLKLTSCHKFAARNSTLDVQVYMVAVGAQIALEVLFADLAPPSGNLLLASKADSGLCIKGFALPRLLKGLIKLCRPLLPRTSCHLNRSASQ